MKKWKIGIGVLVACVVLAVSVLGLHSTKQSTNPKSQTNQAAPANQANSQTKSQIGSQTNLQPGQTNSTSPSSGQSQTKAPTERQNQIVDPNAAKYEGQANLTKYENAAQSNPANAADQVNAAVSSYVNSDYTKAAAYYKKAIALQPKNGQYLTYLGNVYFRGLNNPQEAQKYYTEATQYSPKYAYSWLNLALCESTLGNKSAAIAAVNKGIASVDPADPVLKTLKQLQTTLNK